jgi:hypothetical protein
VSLFDIITSRSYIQNLHYYNYCNLDSEASSWRGSVADGHVE